jgi:simple sugar transport system permease protein
MPLKIQKRRKSLGWSRAAVLCAALALALALSALFLALLGKPALEGMLLLFKGAFGSSWALEDTLIKSIPIFFCSLGVAVAFKLGIWNIGAEGQFALGAIGATWVALSFPGLPWFLLLPGMLLAATLAGAFWGFIPAFFKVRMQANEIIVSLMLNYIGILFLEFLVYGVWKDKASFGFPMTEQFAPAAIIGSIGDSRIHWGLVLAIGIAILLSLFLSSTRLGYELKVSGKNVRAARYAHIPYNWLVILVMLISGALAAWAGFVETSATLNRLQPTVMAGYGYTAIVVAWLAQLNPLGIAVASFLLAGLRVGVEGLQLDFQVPAAFGSIMEGLILLSVLSAQFFKHYRLTSVRNKISFSKGDNP